MVCLPVKTNAPTSEEVRASWPRKAGILLLRGEDTTTGIARQHPVGPFVRMWVFGRHIDQISVPAAMTHSEHDEFIRREQAEYLARGVPRAEFVEFYGVSHFAPLQRHEQVNHAMLAFLGKVMP